MNKSLPPPDTTHNVAPCFPDRITSVEHKKKHRTNKLKSVTANSWKYVIIYQFVNLSAFDDSTGCIFYPIDFGTVCFWARKKYKTLTKNAQFSKNNFFLIEFVVVTAVISMLARYSIVKCLMRRSSDECLIFQKFRFFLDIFSIRKRFYIFKMQNW